MGSKEHKQEAQESRPHDCRPAEVEGEIVAWDAPGEVDEAPLSIPAMSTGSDWNWLGRYLPFVGTLQSQNKALETKLEEMRQRLGRRDREIAQLRERLSERKREVGDLKETLSMYDDCSEVDITSAMKGINTRIQSLARNTAQRWLRGFSGASEGGSNTFLSETEMETVKRTVGPQLANTLGSPPAERSRCVVVLLPLAWQASTVTVVAKILSSFVEGLPTSAEGGVVDAELRAVSRAVKEGEIQPAYGRWRFITHQYIRRRIHLHHERAVQFYVREALEHCYLAARLALKSSCPDDQAFLDAFHAQMTEIMEETFKLRTKIQEKMLTANYDPYLPTNGTIFRSDIMEVAKEDEEHSKDTVICTTRLGMISSRKRERENSREPVKELSLKAQVLTDRNLGDIIA